MKSCQKCRKFVGLDDFHIWHSYRPTTVLYSNGNNEDDDINNYDATYNITHNYICVNCHPCLSLSWKCYYCQKRVYNEELFCDSIQKGNKTCLDCLNKYKQENQDDLSCDCNICKEINQSYNFQPK